MSKYIGDVSAYAYAVSKGYTGTEEEFAELMASYADVGQTAVDAKDAAVAAKTAAETAATTATTKAGEAQTASTKASEASQSASTASQKATESAQSATNASQSAQTALQAKTASQTAQGLAEQAKADAISAKEDAETARDEAQSIVDGISGKVEQIDSNTERIESLEDDRYKPYAVDTASGAVASFSDGADDIPLKSLVVDINPVQDTSSGDPSPTNICPISGWTGMQLSANGTVIPISWQTEAGTVYGGSLDVLSGVLRVTHKTIEFDGSSDERWSRYTISEDNILYRTVIDDRKQEQVSRRTIEGDSYVCNSYVMAVDNVSSRYAGTFSGGSATGMDFVNNSYADVNEWRTALASNPIQFYYPMETPIEIQLTPHEVKSLLGANNIFADTGDSTVEYRADTRLYIEKLTQPEEYDMIADSAITSGQFFMIGNSLYRALANIASGATITVGTNAQRVSLSDALNLVNA